MPAPPSRIDTLPFMRALAGLVLTSARRHIEGGPKGRAGQALHVKRVTPTEIEFSADHPADYLIAGWEQSPMYWLLGRRVAFVPKGQTKRIVRWVTARSMANGGWVRPARPPHDVWAEAWADPAVTSFQGSMAEFLSLAQPEQPFTWAPPD